MTPPMHQIATPAPSAGVIGARSTARYGDIDEQAAALQGWNQNYLQISRGRFDGTVQRLQLEGVGLFIEDLRQSVHQTGWVTPDVFALGVPLALDGDAQFCGQRADGHALHVFSGGGGFEFRSPQRHLMIGIEIDRALFQAHLAHALGDTPGQAPAERARLHATDPAVLNAVRGFLVDLFRCAVPTGVHADAPAHALLGRQVRTQLLDRMALALAPREPVDADEGRCATLAQRALVARATDFVVARLGEPPSVGELCEVLGVSRRTLQSAFQRCWGMGPLAWLTTMRLNAARRRLKSAASVTEAATEFGFWHFGHFAADYQALFGECPSHTLRRHRVGGNLSAH